MKGYKRQRRSPHKSSGKEKGAWAPWLWRARRVVSLLVGNWGCFWAPPLGLFTPQKAPGHPIRPPPNDLTFTLPLHMAAQVEFPKNSKKGPNHLKAQRELGEMRRGEKFLGIRGKEPHKIAATPAHFSRELFFCLSLLPPNFVRP